MIIGHQKQREFFEKAIFSGNIPHALLFEGEPNIGKRTFALYLFKALNCGSKEDRNPCGKCPTCLSVDKMAHPDLLLVNPVEKEIRISQIRDLIRKISFSAHSSPLKWAVIDEAHLMNQEAKSSLLKLLEEPRGRAVIVLISEYPEALFATIKSRVQRIRFFPVEDKEISFFLKKSGCRPDIAEEITLFSFGKPGIAIDFLSNPNKIESRREKAKKLIDVAASNTHKRFQYAKEMAGNPGSAKETLEVWLSYLRRVFLEKSRKNRIGRSFSEIKSRIEKIEETIYLISKTNVNAKMALEVLMMEI